MDITQEIVREFCRDHLASRNAKEVDKNDSALMDLFGQALETLRIQDKEQFKTGFVSTFDFGPAGKYCYTPVPFGTSEDRWVLIGDVAVCVHEVQHLDDAKAQGFIYFGGCYLLNNASRTLDETTAITAFVEMYYFLTGTIPSAELVVSSLQHYGLTSDHVEVARACVQSITPTLLAGGIGTSSAKDAIKWFQSRYPQLRKAP